MKKERGLIVAEKITTETKDSLNMLHRKKEHLIFQDECHKCVTNFPKAGMVRVLHSVSPQKTKEQSCKCNNPSY